MRPARPLGRAVSESAIEMNARLLLVYAVREILGLTVMGVALFWSAGRLDWWQAWAAMAVMAAWMIAMAVLVIVVHPALLAERIGRRKGDKPWDARLQACLALAQLSRYILAGWDVRLGATGPVAPNAQIAALIAGALGYAVFVWATASNGFFSQVVRIQTERGHTVETRGPYRYVRHPAYAGAIVYELAVPLLLGSWWAVPTSLLGAVLLWLRTRLEDQTLQRELPGYSEYARRVRYRLLPGVW